MIALTFTVLLTLGAASANFFGVDPNTLSCDPAGQVFLLLPHFTDCNKFYMCTHGNEVEFTCSGNTIFDFHLQTCNHDWATSCWLRRSEQEEVQGSGEEEIEGSGEGSGDFEWFSSDDLPLVEPIGIPAPLTGKVRVQREAPVNSEVPQSHFAAALDCSDARDATKTVPFKGDCQRYWRCSDGLPVSIYCSDGLFFNESSQQCDFEANVRCAVNHEDELQGEFIVYQ